MIIQSNCGFNIFGVSDIQVVKFSSFPIDFAVELHPYISAAGTVQPDAGTINLSDCAYFNLTVHAAHKTQIFSYFYVPAEAMCPLASEVWRG